MSLADVLGFKNSIGQFIDLQFGKVRPGIIEDIVVHDMHLAIAPVLQPFIASPAQSIILEES